MLIIGLDTVNQAIISGWINRVCRHDSRERAFVIGYSDAVSQAMNIWTNIVFYPTSSAPKFHLGFIISTIAAILMLFLPILGHLGTKWDTQQRLKAIEEEVGEASSSTDSVQLEVDHAVSDEKKQ
ncbi:unnamed protein product [Ambrosiozyma monospora]|uniref:Unnamed protein product n=1 Tax=Ambrosiozyma monospora TaxID=43982 RepID=A0ACB5U314_AMBMO|nr:unnamed protein product [Ambrosiozyma monospora]